jgi:DNA polymerase III epsilon subunit-like protein
VRAVWSFVVAENTRGGAVPQMQVGMVECSKESGQAMIIFDFETGGVSPEHPNIQLAAIAVDENWDEVDSFESKIAFDPARCDPEALKLNHYDAAAWANAPGEREVFGKFSAFLKKHSTFECVSKRTGNPYKVARIAAYNAQFDKDRLWAMGAGQFIPAHPQAFCVMQLAMWVSYNGMIETASMKLSDVAKAVLIPAKDAAHEALADVRMAAEVGKRLLQIITK